MYKRLIPISLLLIIYLLSCNFIYNHFTKEKTTLSTQQSIKEQIKPALKEITQEIKYILPKDTSIGKLIINKINLKQKLYGINTKENNIEKNVTILQHSEEPSIKNSIMFIAAHSGTGTHAYFRNLDKLELNDQLVLEYKNITYTYKITNIWETKKTGAITVPKEETNQLILTTCSPQKNDYQLVINSLLIKKES